MDNSNLKKITVEVSSDPKHCLYCPFVGTSHFGTRYNCMLFWNEDVELFFDNEHMLAKCKQCLEKC